MQIPIPLSSDHQTGPPPPHFVQRPALSLRGICSQMDSALESAAHPSQTTNFRANPPHQHVLSSDKKFILSIGLRKEEAQALMTG